MNFHNSLHLFGMLLVCSSAFAQSAGYTWAVVDGQPVMVPTYKQPKLTQLVNPPSSPTQLPKNYGSAGSIVNLAIEAQKTATYWTEGVRAANAREEAMLTARKALEETSAKFAAVPWLSDRPHDISNENNPQLYHYTMGKPLVSDDIHVVRKGVYGPIQAEIGPVNTGVTLDSPGYLRGTAIAERNSDGSITTRLADSNDAKKYASEESERIRRQEKNRQDELILEKREAQRAYEDAEKQVAQKQATEKQAAQKQQEEAKQARDTLERERKESEARATQLTENQKALEKRYKERDEACANGRTANCIYVEDKLNNDFDRVLKHQNTVRCMAELEGKRSGPCAPDAPPCMYCSADSDMRKQERWVTYLALEVNTRRSLLQNPSTPLASFEDAVRTTLTNSSIRSKFGVNEFIRQKYGK